MSPFDAKFYDFNTHSGDKQDSIIRLAFEAKRYGYCGIAVINSMINLNTIHKPENFTIYPAVEISCKPSRLRDEIRKYKEGNILIVKGSGEEINRAAAETDGLDILMQPAKFNHVLAKAASDNSIVLGFNIGSIIRTRGEARVRELVIMRSNLKYARKYHLQMALTSDAYSSYDLRPPREMTALAGLFGMTQQEAVSAMSTAPLDIIRRKSPDYIQEGIELV